MSISYTMKDKARSGKPGTGKKYKNGKLSLISYDSKLERIGKKYCEELGIRPDLRLLVVWRRNGHIIKRKPIEILWLFYERRVRMAYTSLDRSLRNNRVSKADYVKYREGLEQYKLLKSQLTLPKIPFPPIP